MLLTDPQRADAPPRIDVQIQLVQKRPSLHVHPFEVDETQRILRFPAQENVFSHAHMRNQVQLLMDDRNASFLSLPGLGEGHHLPVQQDATLVVLTDAGQNLHEGRLARPVLPHYRVDLAGVHAEMGAIERGDAPKAFADALGGKNDLIVLRSNHRDVVESYSEFNRMGTTLRRWVAGIDSPRSKRPPNGVFSVASSATSAAPTNRTVIPARGPLSLNGLMTS